MTGYQQVFSLEACSVVTNISTKTEEEENSIHISIFSYTECMFHLADFFPLNDFQHASLWRENGSLWDPLLFIEEYLKTFSHKIEIKIPTNVVLRDSKIVSIGKGTIVEEGTLIEGPCIIGENCVIRHGAFLRGNIIIGNNCTVGHGCELKNVVLMDKAVAAHLCYVGDSILGPEVNLSAGVKCANLRLDRKEVTVKIQDKKVHTGLKKLGAILGAKVQVGCNSVLNPGTFIGKESAVYPLMNIGGFVPSFSLVKPSTPNLIVESKHEKILENLRR